MEEMGDNARVWRVYNDEADRIDAEMVDGWRSTLDTLLIFAGLFSAVVATFVTQTSQKLQPDFSEVTASLLTELVDIQRTAATNGSISAVNPSILAHGSIFNPERRDVILNGLWFVSLGLTLTTALIAGLVKQWLQFYIADVSGSAKERACTRQFRVTGLSAWGVSPVIEFLPVLMNASLLLFFAGLILFCQQLSGTEGITAIIIALTSISFILYLGSSILSVVYPHCPYKSSLSTMFNLFFRIFWYTIVRIFACCAGFRRDFARTLVEAENLPRAARVRSNLSSMGPVEPVINALYKLSSMKHAESKAISHQQLPLQLQAITSMVTDSANATVPDLALQALAALHTHTFSKGSLPKFLCDRISKTLLDWFPAGSNPKGSYRLPVPPSVVERYSRSMLCWVHVIPDTQTRPIWTFVGQPNPDDLRYLGLRALLIHGAQAWLRDKVRPELDAFLQHVMHQLPPVEIQEVHTWIRGNLRQAMLLAQFDHQDEASMFSHLVQNLSPLKLPTLREDLMLHWLGVKHAPSGFLDDKDARWQMQSHTHVELGKGLGHARFIFILPSLARVALSTGATELDRFLSLMDEMFTGTQIPYFRHQSWKLSPWDTNSNTQADAVSAMEPFRPALEELLDLLISPEEPEYSMLWKGSVSLRLNVIMRLHNALYERDQYHRPTLDAILCWLLRLSSTDEGSYGELPFIDNVDQQLEPQVSSFFYAQIAKQSKHTLDGLCNYLAGHHILGLTKPMLEGLPKLISHRGTYSVWRFLPREMNDKSVIAGLDRLFRYFIQQDPSNTDRRLPSTEVEQQNTLMKIVELARESKANAQDRASDLSWNGLLSSWLALLKEVSAHGSVACPEVATLEQEEENDLRPTRLGLDFPTLIRAVEQVIESSQNPQTLVSNLRGGITNVDPS